MNTEKSVALASVGLLTIMFLASWRVMPALKEIGEQRREGLRPIEIGSDVALRSPDISNYLAEGNNPFMWMGEIPKGPPPTADARNEKPEPPKLPKPPKPSKPPRLPPALPTRRWKLPLSYVGTVKTPGGGQSRQAIFKDEESGKYIKLIKGQEYKKVRLIEVKSNSVILLNEKGKRFVLPNR